MVATSQASPTNPCSSTLKTLVPLARLYTDEDHSEDYDDGNQYQDHQHLPVLLLVLLCLQKRRECVISSQDLTQALDLQQGLKSALKADLTAQPPSV